MNFMVNGIILLLLLIDLHELFINKSLEELAFDFPGLFNNKLSAAVGSAVKKLLSVEKMYCIAIHHDEHIMGNVTIINHKKTEPGNTKLIEAFIQQITTFVKKQKAEDNIREKDIQFRKLSTNLPDLIYQFTRRPDGSYYVPIASKGIKNIFGCQPEDVADNFDAIARVLHPDDFDRVIEDIEYSAEHLTFFTCEFRVLIPGRPVQWIFSRSNPEKLPDGSVTWYGFNANITQQKQTEHALRESEDKYRRIADNVTDVVWVTDLEMNPTYVSPSVERILGIKPEDYLQLPVTQTYPPTSLEQFKKTLTEEFAKEEDPESDRNRIFQLEVERYYADGTIGWDAISANFIRDEQNKPIAIQGVSRDITERIKAEEALRESEDLLTMSQEIAHTGSWKLDLTANRLTWSDEVYRIFGCKPQEFVPSYETFLGFVHPEDRAAVDDAYSRSVQEGSDGYDIEHRIVRQKSGEIRYVHERYVHERDASGAIIQSTGMVQDITERKQNEEELLASEEKFRSIFVSMTEIVVLHELVFDEDDRPVNYRILDCNPAFTRIIGIRREDAVGRLATDVYGSDTAPYLDVYARVALTGDPFTFIAAYAPINKHFDTRVASPGKNLFVTVTTDITEHKLAETYRGMEREILQILTEPDALRESIQRVLAVLKTRTGFDAVGLRLQEGDDYPYFVQDGFSKDFLLNENTLLERGEDGGLCRDKDGNVSLECTCGLVISGKTDPSNPLFTKGGSSWTNDSFPLLDLSSDQDPRLHPRNNCIHQGYASVAQVPVRTKERIVGLIQLNDKRKGRFTLETIGILESIAAHIGSALIRKQAESELRRLSTAIEQSPETVVITDIEGTIQYVNPAFETTTGYTHEEAIGKNPSILKSGQQDAEFYTAMWNTLLNRRVWCLLYTKST
jgi:PAS domain S-box-containing protein